MKKGTLQYCRKYVFYCSGFHRIIAMQRFMLKYLRKKKTNRQTDLNKCRRQRTLCSPRHAWARYYGPVGINFRNIPCRKTNLCASRRPLHTAKWHWRLPSESQLDSKLFSGADWGDISVYIMRVAMDGKQDLRLFLRSIRYVISCICKPDFGEWYCLISILRIRSHMQS